VTTQYVGEAEYCDAVALLAEGELVALDTPTAMRQRVFGGEVLEIETDAPISPDLLGNVGEVLSVRQAAPRKLIAVVSDAGTATPRLMETITDGGIGVISMEEYQPSFDEVFAELVRERRAERAGADSAAGEEGSEHAA
jgi:ABC-2 type transport system ATP-binding protein